MKDEGDQTQQNQDKDDQLSFYSDDSFEYVPVSPELAARSKFHNVNGLRIPELDFEGLPEYETTDEEDEDEED
jgi:hypothetical protein